jgi:hypothetical protein
LTSISTIEPLHAIEKRGCVVEINVRLYAATTGGGKTNLRAAPRRVAPGQSLAQSVLKKRCKCRASLRRELLPLEKELIV